MACAKKKCCAKKAAPKAAAAEKLFEGYERREAKILAALKPFGIKSILECKEICDKAGVDAYKIVEETQPICFENAKWAYTVGAAIAINLATSDVNATLHGQGTIAGGVDVERIDTEIPFAGVLL